MQCALFALVHHHGLLTCHRIWSCQLFSYALSRLVAVSHCWSKLSDAYSSEVRLADHLHLIWLFWPPWSLPQLVLGSSLLKKWRHFVQLALCGSTYVWQGSSMCIFLCKMIGVFAASCRIVENRAMREGKIKTGGDVYLKKCGCENGGKTQEGYNFIFTEKHLPGMQAIWKQFHCKPQFSVAVLVLFYMDKRSLKKEADRSLHLDIPAASFLVSFMIKLCIFCSSGNREPFTALVYQLLVCKRLPFFSACFAFQISYCGT